SQANEGRRTRLRPCGAALRRAAAEPGSPAGSSRLLDPLAAGPANAGPPDDDSRSRDVRSCTMVVEQAEQTFAAFVLDQGSQAKSLLASIEKIDEVDADVRIVDAAIVDRTKRGRIKVHQTTDRGALKSGARGGTLGVIVGALVLGPAGAVVGGAAGSFLGSLRGKIHDTGINDKFMKEVAAEIEKGKSALFVQYEGNWSGSLGVVEQAIKEHNAM